MVPILMSRSALLMEILLVALTHSATISRRRCVAVVVKFPDAINSTNGSIRMLYVMGMNVAWVKFENNDVETSAICQSQI